AITAFVGDGAEAYLPNPAGLDLICWPTIGTNPDELRRLIDSDVNVYFSDNLHMKIYWSRKGAIITSANLSDNALSGNKLKEVGILVDSTDIDIERIKSTLTISPVTRKTLSKLDREHNLERKTSHKPEKENRTFLDWFFAPMRTPTWKLGWWDEQMDYSKKSIEIAKKEYGRETPLRAITGKSRDYKEGEWVLQFKLLNNTPANFSWLFVDHKLQVPSSDKKAYDPKYPYEYFQARAKKSYPFILDKKFKESFKSAVRELGGAKIKSMKSLIPEDRLLKLIANRLE
ncbi:MAG TPA: hypothetical protein VF905_07045, partial [Nitrospirota bacterium]